ncbi:integrase, catalytic region, zinc finger, CCHC-type containing protein [Tanacetum coccineum]
MSTANQQTLAESGAESRPPILKKGSYVPWASWFLRILNNKREEGELMRHSIDKGPYKRKEIVDPNDNSQKILEPIKELSNDDQKQYYADIKVMNYILQGIPNDIYNSVDACNDTETMWNRIKRLMQGEISINTKLLKSLQPEWSKYVTLTRQKYILKKEHYDVLYDYLSQFEPHVNASKAKKAARNHDPLALVANSYAHASHSHATITQHYSTPTNNRLRTSSNTRNQAVIQDGHVDIQSKNVGYAGNGKKNVQCYNCNGKGHYARECPKPRVRDAKYFREKILLAAKDEAGVNLDAEENDFMPINAYGDDQLEELNASVIMMAHIQPTNDKSDAEPTYDAELISEKLETVIHTSADDQIDSDIIFNDPYVDNNSGQAEHDPNAHDQPYADIETLIYNVQVEAQNQRKINNELKKQKSLFQKELKTSYEDLQKQISVEQQTIEKLQNEKDEIQDRFLKARDESLIIKNETESFKKAFKIREDKYLDDIVTLKEKLKSHERVVFKMLHSLQTIHMLGTTPNLFYDPNIKDGLGYKNPEHLKKAIEAQPKMYYGKNLKYHA